ncbi:recombinase family protein [Roseovarius ramblicola]|uniref:Recombinase family protein n=1 Tax=Roseovarius ramblicola TaxID=2022336 RepID=A0ABV5I3M1_9RHOB
MSGATGWHHPASASPSSRRTSRRGTGRGASRCREPACRGSCCGLDATGLHLAGQGVRVGGNCLPERKFTLAGPPEHRGALRIAQPDPARLGCRQCPLAPVTGSLRSAGVTSLRALADELNTRGIRTRRGGRWHVSTVRNLLVRLKQAP